MQLTFGMYLDGTNWSEKQASSGEIQLGPFGMLSLLETKLGLSGSSVHPAVRINQYMHRLEACDHVNAWFHNSFTAGIAGRTYAPRNSRAVGSRGHN